ncbi:MAG: hypothetical protein AABW92_00280 [Nanoarchaeota archaeon]
MIGGDSDRGKIAEAFSKIKEDMAKLNQEVYALKLDQKKLVEENLTLKKQILGNVLDKTTISEVVKETLKHHVSNNNHAILKKFNKKRKSILNTRISSLAMQQKLTLPEIKEIVVDQESLCSKATFYRYVDKMKSQGLIDSVKINELDIVVRT